MNWFQKKRDVYTLILYVPFVISAILFVYNLLPLNVKPKKYIVGEDSSFVSREYSKKIVLFIIDGLRMDQLNSSTGDKMPFVESSIRQKHSCFLKTNVKTPTVTMPRIKAITSGTLPSFTDVVMNLGSTEFMEDTFIRQAQLNKLTTVFYGDDTWLKMFPNRFTRSQGVSSFFASDFTEVDDNVTRALESELTKDRRWNLIVLHYLGLDHLGHTEGPRGRNVPGKLREMDNIVKKVYNHLQDIGGGLLILTSDHGTKNSGGHGGVTQEEVSVPLVLVNTLCTTVPGWPDESNYVVEQIDLASTISILLGLPIPFGNTGKPVPALLHGIPVPVILKHLINAKNNLQRLTSSGVVSTGGTDALYGSWSKTEDESAAIDLGKRLYTELKDLSDQLNRKKSEFNVPLLYCISISMSLLFIMTVCFLHFPYPKNKIELFLAFGTLLHTISMASTSFIEEEHQTWYFLWTTNLIMIIHEVVVSENSQSHSRRCFVIGALILCISHRLLRCLNQTGDKWSATPDFSDYLIEHSNLLVLQFLLSLVILWILFTLSCRSILSSVFFGAAVVCAAAYRLATDKSIFPRVLNWYPSSKGNYEVNVYFVLVLVLIAKRTPFLWIWSLLSILTMRPATVVIVPAEILVSYIIKILFKSNDFWLGVSHVWIGQLFYFYQGNSNSLANIDIAAGFIGCTNYNIIYAGIMITINTFSAPVLAFLLSPQHYASFLGTYVMQLTVYCPLLVYQRYHLFIWSVFLPKLIYLIAFLIILYVVSLSHCAISTLKKSSI